MEVAVDQIWATPSTLHMRIVVWGPDRAWRHKYYAATPLKDIDEHVTTMLVEYHMDQGPDEDLEQMTLL